MAEGVNVTGVTHLHYEYSYTVGINETYPYHYIGLLPVSFHGHNIDSPCHICGKSL
jgi:hypothetical protein